jgi:hypothetical protein
VTAENVALCPGTTALLQSIGPRLYGHAFFSALAPGTHITKHHGPTNKKLRLHLPLVGTDGSRLRVADDTRDVVAGQARAPPACASRAGSAAGALSRGRWHCRFRYSDTSSVSKSGIIWMSGSPKRQCNRALP